MTVITARILLPVGLAISVLPLALTGCGNTGTGASLKETAFLTLPPLENNQTASITPEKNSGEMLIKAVPIKSPSEKKAKEKTQELVGPKMAVKSEPINTANANTPPMPIRRPYRKVRSKKRTARLIEEQKSVTLKPVVKKAVAKVEAKMVVNPKLQARAIPAEVAPVIAKAPTVEMIPVKAVPVQVVPDETPQDIIDAFKDDMGVRALEQMAADEDVPGKVAKAESVPNEPRFGRSEYRFSGQ